MSVGFVIVTHGQTGKSLVAEAEFVLGQSMKEVVLVSFNQSEGSLDSVSDIRLAIEKADSGDGVLVMTDLIGASPSNRVARLLEEYDAVMVTGVNLPMTICVWNYREQPLGLVARKAVDGGRPRTVHQYPGQQPDPDHDRGQQLDDRDRPVTAGTVERESVASKGAHQLRQTEFPGAGSVDRSPAHQRRQQSPGDNPAGKVRYRRQASGGINGESKYCRGLNPCRLVSIASFRGLLYSDG